MEKLALPARLEAKSGKEKEVADFRPEKISRFVISLIFSSR